MDFRGPIANAQSILIVGIFVEAMGIGALNAVHAAWVFWL